MTKFSSKALKPFRKTVNVFSSQDVNIQAPFTIIPTNRDSMYRDLGPRPCGDNKHLSVYEVLGELEDNARIAFQKRTFNTVEVIHAGSDHYAIFFFKELRKREDGTYVAYYEFYRISGNDEQDNN